MNVRESKRLKVFSDRAYLSQGQDHVAMLYPFWGKNPEDPGDPSSGRFDRYVEAGRGFFEMTTLENADVAVFPEAWEHVIGNVAAVARAERFLAMACRAKKATVIFFWSDSNEGVPYNDTVVFRTSLYRSHRRRNEFAMPAWSEDFVERYLDGKLPLRQKRAKPVVGFCGYLLPPPQSRYHKMKSRLLLAWHVARSGTIHGCDHDPSRFIRAKALQILGRSHTVETNFLIREHFLGGAWIPSEDVNWTDLQRTRREYVQNICGSDYVLCTRGGGNFSYRLYETLSCGRIPVFVDTDCVLPYDSEIKWKDYCVWVDEKEVNRIGEKIAEFHESLSDQQFVELQRECRRLWESHLCPEGFFANLHKHFR